MRACVRVAGVELRRQSCQRIINRAKEREREREGGGDWTCNAIKKDAVHPRRWHGYSGCAKEGCGAEMERREEDDREDTIQRKEEHREYIQKRNRFHTLGSVAARHSGEATQI